MRIRDWSSDVCSSDLWSLDTRAADAARARGGRWKWLAYLKDHRLWVVGIGVLALFATIFSFSLLPMTFQPSIDSDTSRVAIQLAPGATPEQPEAVADEVTDLMKRDSPVESALARIDVGHAAEYPQSRREERQNVG